MLFGTGLVGDQKCEATLPVVEIFQSHQQAITLNVFSCSELVAAFVLIFMHLSLGYVPRLTITSIVQMSESQ